MNVVNQNDTCANKNCKYNSSNKTESLNTENEMVSLFGLSSKRLIVFLPIAYLLAYIEFNTA